MQSRESEQHKYNTRSRSGQKGKVKINLTQAEMGERRDGNPQRELNDFPNSFCPTAAVATATDATTITTDAIAVT